MKTLNFHIISDNAAPFANDGLFHIVGHHDYELNEYCTQQMAVEYAKRWFAKQMAEYGVNISDMDLDYCRTTQKVIERGEEKIYYYYLGCNEIYDMDFPYSLINKQVSILTARQRDYHKNAALVEQFNFTDYNGISA